MARPEPMAGSPPVLSAKGKGVVAEENRIKGSGVGRKDRSREREKEKWRQGRLHGNTCKYLSCRAEASS